MRWPYHHFSQRSLAKVVSALILVSVFVSPLFDSCLMPARASNSSYSAIIIDFAYQPLRINVTTGTEVIWTNNGNTQHTVTSSPQTNTTQRGTPLISSGPLNPGQNFSYVFYEHDPTMNSLVNVTGSDLQPPPVTTPPSVDYTPYVIGGTIAGAVVVASMALFVRRRTKKTGRFGISLAIELASARERFLEARLFL